MIDLQTVAGESVACGQRCDSDWLVISSADTLLRSTIIIITIIADQIRPVCPVVSLHMKAVAAAAASICHVIFNQSILNFENVVNYETVFFDSVLLCYLVELHQWVTH